MPARNSKRHPWEEELEALSLRDDLFQSCWSKRSSKSLSDHVTILYQCKNAVTVGCPAILRKDVHTDGTEKWQKAYLHCEDCTRSGNNKKISLNTEIIRSMDLKILKPWDIKKHIEQIKNADGESTFGNVDLVHVQTAVQNIKRKSIKSASSTTTDDIVAMCDRLSISQTAQEPFVLAYSINPTKLIVTSEHLLSKLTLARNVHIDATYKLMTCNYPLIIVGISDLQSTFYLTAVAIVEAETAEAYKWVLQIIVEKCRSLNIHFHPTAVIADNSSAISLAVSQVFPECKRLHCWFHTWKLIDALLKPYTSFRDMLSDDIHFLQTLFHPTLFSQALELFERKWNKLTELIKTFSDHHIRHNQNWNEAADIFAPSTNNCLERFNRTIKTRYTKMNRSNILDFVEKICFEMIKDASLDNDYNLTKIKYNEPSSICISQFEDPNFCAMKTIES